MKHTHSFMLFPTIKEIDVMEVAMNFFPYSYKDLAIKVKEENNTITSSYNGITREVKITSNQKNAVKKCVYLLLCEITGKTFPWGTLTGVKPVFLVRKLFNELSDEKKVCSFLTEEYLMDEKKAVFLIQIYYNQKNFYSPKKENQ